MHHGVTAAAALFSIQQPNATSALCVRHALLATCVVHFPCTAAQRLEASALQPLFAFRVAAIETVAAVAAENFVCYVAFN